MNTAVMFSSKTDNWATPQEFFDELNREFHFDLDPCASETNHKCDTFYTVASDGLSQNWGGIVCFVTRRMVETLANGLKSLMRKAEKITHW